MDYPRCQVCKVVIPSGQLCLECSSREPERILQAAMQLADSGARQSFPSGAEREPTPGRGRFDLLPPYCLQQIARHYEAGAQKYADRNWEKGLPLARFLDSAMRHLCQLMAGDQSEDHVSAVVWNVWGFSWTWKAILDGGRPLELAKGLPPGLQRVFEQILAVGIFEEEKSE